MNLLSIIPHAIIFAVCLVCYFRPGEQPHDIHVSGDGLLSSRKTMNGGTCRHYPYRKDGITMLDLV